MNFSRESHTHWRRPRPWGWIRVTDHDVERISFWPIKRHRRSSSFDWIWRFQSTSQPVDAMLRKGLGFLELEALWCQALLEGWVSNFLTFLNLRDTPAGPTLWECWLEFCWEAYATKKESKRQLSIFSFLINHFSFLSFLSFPTKHISILSSLSYQTSFLLCTRAALIQFALAASALCKRNCSLRQKREVGWRLQLSPVLKCASHSRGLEHIAAGSEMLLGDWIGILLYPFFVRKNSGIQIPSLCWWNIASAFDTRGSVSFSKNTILSNGKKQSSKNNDAVIKARKHHYYHLFPFPKPLPNVTWGRKQRKMTP